MSHFFTRTQPARKQSSSVFSKFSSGESNYSLVIPLCCNGYSGIVQAALKVLELKTKISRPLKYLNLRTGASKYLIFASSFSLATFKLKINYSIFIDKLRKGTRVYILRFSANTGFLYLKWIKSKLLRTTRWKAKTFKVKSLNV